MATYGSPIDVEPHVALLDEIKRTAGHVAWLNGVIGELGRDVDDGEIPAGLTQTNGKTFVQTPAVWIEMYQEERRMLARVCKMALDAGVNERVVQLAERQGEMLAQVIKAILGDLELTKDQQAKAGPVVRRHLMALTA